MNALEKPQVLKAPVKARKRSVSFKGRLSRPVIVAWRPNAAQVTAIGWKRSGVRIRSIDTLSINAQSAGLTPP